MTDSHLGHKKLLEYGERPEHFDLEILNGLERFSGDLLIHLGDLCIGQDEYNNRLLLDAAAGFSKKVLVKGNHDNKSDAWYYKQGWDCVVHFMGIKAFGKNLFFSHKPRTKESIPDTHFNIHGHLHGGGVKSHRADEITGYDPEFHIDVAPELRGYEPLNLEKLI